MKKFAKRAAILLSLVAFSSFTAFVGCDDPANSSSSSTHSSTDSSDSSQVQDNACTDEKKGHAYSEDTGVCIRCGKEAVIPPPSANMQYPLVEPCTHTKNGNCSECLYQGAGEEYNRFELFLNEGYTVEIGSSGELWLSFSTKEYGANANAGRSGQFVLRSVGGSNGVKVTRHSATTHYVTPDGKPAVEKDGDFYSFVNCSDAENNEQWRATYCLKGEKGTQVKVYFVRIADPVWEAKTIRTKVYAQELKEKAPEPEANQQLVEVDYKADYFYSDPATGGDGYYHLGTKENPGKIIYAAISKSAVRLFGEDSSTSFTNVLKSFGAALDLQDGYTADGDYNILCYTPFIMNWKNDDASWGSRPGSEEETPETDPNKVCYQNYCNSDGVYPVNAELFKFLNLYVAKNKPVDDAITNEDYQNKAPWIWLSACFTYEEIKLGTQKNPLPLAVGKNTVTTLKWDTLYCGFADKEGSYTVSFAFTGTITVNNTDYTDTCSITANGDEILTLSMADGSVAEITVTVTKNE